MFANVEKMSPPDENCGYRFFQKGGGGCEDWSKPTCASWVGSSGSYYGRILLSFLKQFITFKMAVTSNWKSHSSNHLISLETISVSRDFPPPPSYCSASSEVFVGTYRANSSAVQLDICKSKFYVLFLCVHFLSPSIFFPFTFFSLFFPSIFSSVALSLSLVLFLGRQKKGECRKWLAHPQSATVLYTMHAKLAVGFLSI